MSNVKVVRILGSKLNDLSELSYCSNQIMGGTISNALEFSQRKVYLDIILYDIGGI